MRNAWGNSGATILNRDLRGNAFPAGWLNGPVACQVGYLREHTVTVTPTGESASVAYQSSDDDFLQVSLKEYTADGAVLELTPQCRGTPVFEARLGTSGPIMATQEVDEFALDNSAAYLLVVMPEGDEGGRRGYATLTMRPLLPNLEIEMWVCSPGLTFDGGISSMTISTNDFEAQADGSGTYNYWLHLAPGYDAICVNMNVVQSSSPERRCGKRRGDNGVVENCICNVALSHTNPGGTVITYSASGEICNPCRRAGFGKNKHQYKWDVTDAQNVLTPGSKTPDPEYKDKAGGTSSSSTKDLTLRAAPPDGTVKIEVSFVGDGCMDWDGTGNATEFCSIEQDLFAVCNGTIAMVDFSSDARPGVDDNRSHTIQATIQGDVTVQFSTTNPQRATVTPATAQGPGEVDVTVNGVSWSPKDLDIKLQAKTCNTYLAGETPITVVEPKDYENEGRVEQTLTGPQTVSGIPGYVVPVVITIKDEWGETLRANWDGTLVEEQLDGDGIWRGIGSPAQTLTNGTITDPVGTFFGTPGTKTVSMQLRASADNNTYSFPAFNTRVSTTTDLGGATRRIVVTNTH